MKKPGAYGQKNIDESQERSEAARRARSIADFDRLGIDDEPVVRCWRCAEPAMWWLRREDGQESLRCDRHGLASVTTEIRAIDPFDWRSLPADPFVSQP